MSVILAVFVAFFGGFLVIFNRSGNVRLHKSHSLLTTVTLNHVVGFLSLLLIVSIGPDQVYLSRAFEGPLWHQVAGPLGVVFLCTAIASIKHLGVLRSTLLIIAGQMVGMFAIDIGRNRFESPGLAAVGVGLIVLGVLANQFRRRGPAQ